MRNFLEPVIEKVRKGGALLLSAQEVREIAIKLDDLTAQLTEAIAERDAAREALTGLLLEFVNSSKDGNIDSFPASTKAAVRKAEAKRHERGLDGQDHS
jgi:hypothetical protein